MSGVTGWNVSSSSKEWISEWMNEWVSLCSPPLIETYREGAVCPSYACLYSFQEHWTLFFLNDFVQFCVFDTVYLFLYWYVADFWPTLYTWHDVTGGTLLSQCHKCELFCTIALGRCVAYDRMAERIAIVPPTFSNTTTTTVKPIVIMNHIVLNWIQLFSARSYKQCHKCELSYTKALGQCVAYDNNDAIINHWNLYIHNVMKVTSCVYRVDQKLHHYHVLNVGLCSKRISKDVIPLGLLINKLSFHWRHNCHN